MSGSESSGLAVLRAIAAVVREHEQELSRLDAAIGDGDHGANLARGFAAVLPKVEQQADQSLGALLKTTATTLISTVGGAAGPLYGTAFLRAATVLSDKQEPDSRDLLAAFEAAVEGVKARGKATTGEKTMIDALQPAADAFRTAIDDGEDVSVALERAAAAARTGMESTIPMIATKGRASYLGERSIGHQDPGATSSYLMLQSISDTVQAGKA